MLYVCLIVNIFGQLIGSAYIPLAHNSVITSNTIIYCVTENKNTPQVMWSFVNLAGIRTDLTSITDSNTGISTLQVYTTQPGYYSCEVSENGGVSIKYTAIVIDGNIFSGILFDIRQLHTMLTCQFDILQSLQWNLNDHMNVCT